MARYAPPRRRRLGVVAAAAFMLYALTVAGGRLAGDRLVARLVHGPRAIGALAGAVGLDAAIGLLAGAASAATLVAARALRGTSGASGPSPPRR